MDWQVQYLLMRENLHGKLICSDELEVCGGFLTKEISTKTSENAEILITSNDLTTIFDNQYRNGLRFKNEKMLAEKKSGNYLFL